jgi:hypothetical protein
VPSHFKTFAETCLTVQVVTGKLHTAPCIGVHYGWNEAWGAQHSFTQMFLMAGARIQSFVDEKRTLCVDHLHGDDLTSALVATPGECFSGPSTALSFEIIPTSSLFEGFSSFRMKPASSHARSKSSCIAANQDGAQMMTCDPSSKEQLFRVLPLVQSPGTLYRPVNPQVDVRISRSRS